MRVEIDDKSGFCFGVVRAIDKAERARADYGTVYSLGDIVHNRIEVQRLEELGLRTVTHADMPQGGTYRNNQIFGLYFIIIPICYFIMRSY